MKILTTIILTGVMTFCGLQLGRVIYQLQTNIEALEDSVSVLEAHAQWGATCRLYGEISGAEAAEVLWSANDGAISCRIHMEDGTQEEIDETILGEFQDHIRETSNQSRSL